MESYHHGNDVSGTAETEAGPSSAEQCSNEQCANSLDDAVGKLLQGSLSSSNDSTTSFIFRDFYREILSLLPIFPPPISPPLIFPCSKPRRIERRLER